VVSPPGTYFETTIPTRLDRLPWSAFHTRVVLALGITWLLDGLEVTVVGSLGAVLREPDTLHFSDAEVGLSATAYLAGAIVGALLFGHLTDRLGRKRLFLVTLTLYLCATALTGLSVGFRSFVFFRALTGMGIGGEYAAMNSAIDELLPARVRGVFDLALNGTYWLGAALGAGTSALFLSPRVLGHHVGWRAMFGVGAILGGAILLIRRMLPESPRWLLTHGRFEEAETVVRAIEHEIECEKGALPVPAGRPLRIVVRTPLKLLQIARTLFIEYRSRTFFGLSLMVSQAFFYNAIFFTYSLVLVRFYAVAPERVGLYLLPFSFGNFIGPLALGRLFDTVGRRPMIMATYAGAALLLSLTAVLFGIGVLDAFWQTALWTLVFFVASAAASSAYLTVSEIFPLEIRALAIAVFYAVGTAVGGLLAPTLFGLFIGTGRRSAVVLGYVLGAVLMWGAALVTLFFGVRAERRSLEDVASPLSEV
jgi:MFS family permease